MVRFLRQSLEGPSHRKVQLRTPLPQRSPRRVTATLALPPLLMPPPPAHPSQALENLLFSLPLLSPRHLPPSVIPSPLQRVQSEDTSPFNPLPPRNTLLQVVPHLPALLSDFSKKRKREARIRLLLPCRTSRSRRSASCLLRHRIDLQPSLPALLTSSIPHRFLLCQHLRRPILPSSTPLPTTS